MPALAVITALLLTQTPPPASAPDQSPAGHRLVWSDEFSTDGPPDPARWAPDASRNRQGWYNNELQYYAAGRSRNARVEHGHLIIEAHREPVEAAAFPDTGGQGFTSARLDSVGPGWTYGRFEARVRLPCARGSWPAVWMLPAGGGDWPLGGEIDILEHVGHDPGVVHGTVHTGAYNHVAGAQRGGQTAIPDACQAFHRYQADWTPQAIVFSVDDVAYYRFDNDGRGQVAAWPFDAPFRLILNLAVGGDWGGAQGVDAAAFPQRMEVDYVRVWQAE